jgi:hypothetical protein
MTAKMYRGKNHFEPQLAIRFDRLTVINMTKQKKRNGRAVDQSHIADK